MRLKICGLTDAAQAQAIAGLGVHALGFICVPGTPRYVDPTRLATLTRALPPFVERVGVFMDAPNETIRATVRLGGITAIQLHGEESPGQCARLGLELPGVSRIKALRIRGPQDLARVRAYHGAVDAVLLDAWHPERAGGTGLTINRHWLVDFEAGMPWILAGGLNPANLGEVLDYLHPGAVDLSSGVETRPGIKDLDKVARVLSIVQRHSHATA